MSALTSWLTYIRIRREDGGRPFLNEIYASGLISATFLGAWYLAGMPNSFGDGGLIDGLATLTTFLAGFFVAGLVAIATFFRENSSLDDIIEKGPAILDFGTENAEHLTRRQYVCSMFGFLVALSFFLAISATVLRAFSTPISSYMVGTFSDLSDRVDWRALLEGAGVFVWVGFFTWQILLTLRGLYYLMDRIYDVRPKLGQPKESEAESDDGPRVTLP